MLFYSEWQPGDVVSVLLSWDGIVSFWMNGKDMGPASKKLDANRKWFPAISLSAGQYCTFAFAEEDFRFHLYLFNFYIICVKNIF